MPRRLPQYLKQERRRAGFSQADIAHLLGARERTQVWRYECGRHLPTLRTALAYEALLGVPVAQLFPKAFAEARRALVSRVKQRAAIMAKRPQTARNLRRQRSLESIIAAR